MSVSIVQAVPDFVRTGARDAAIGLGLVAGGVLGKHLWGYMTGKHPLKPLYLTNEEPQKALAQETGKKSKKQVRTTGDSYKVRQFAGWNYVQKSNQQHSIVLETSIPNTGRGNPVPRPTVNKPEIEYEFYSSTKPSRVAIFGFAALGLAPMLVRIGLRAWQKKA